MVVVEHTGGDRIEFMLEWERLTGSLPFQSWLLAKQAE